MASTNEPQVQFFSFKQHRQLKDWPRSKRDRACLVATSTFRGPSGFSCMMLMAALIGGCLPDDVVPDIEDSVGSGSQDSQDPDPSPSVNTSSTGSSADSDTSSGEESGTSTDSSPETTPGDSDPSTSTQGSGSTSTDSNTDSPDEDSSDPADIEPDDPRLRLVIKEDVELCSRCEGYTTTFDTAFETKQRLQLQPGRFPFDGVVMAGEVFRGETPYSFESSPFAMSATNNLGILLADSQDATAVLPGGEPMTIALELYNDYRGNPFEFVLDDLSRMQTTTDFKRLALSTKKFVPALNDSKYRNFGSCRMQKARHDVFRFELEGDSFVEFETYSKHFSYFGGQQAGQTIRAAGNFRGYKFEIDDLDKLIYCHPRFCNSLKIPDLAVRFPEQNGVCGIGLRADRRDKAEGLYTAELLNCDLDTIHTIDIVDAQIPSAFDR